MKRSTAPGARSAPASSRVQCLALLLLGMTLLVGPAARAGEEPSRWSGIDETVVERVAAEAGRTPHGLLFEIDQGDLPLFLFLCAGIVGGSVLGYCFRMLFVEKIDQKPRAE